MTTIYDNPARALDEPTLPLDGYAAQLTAARTILDEHGAASLHEHAVRMPEGLDESGWARWRETGAEVLAVDEIAAAPYRALVTSCLALQSFDAVLAWTATISSQRDSADLGGTTLLLGLEDLGSCDGSLQRVEALYEAGIRVAGITYNAGNAFGTGLAHTGDEGLTTGGRQAVALMNELGMIVDVAHTSEPTAFDAVDASSTPIVLSHAGAAAVWPSRRMKSDELIRTVAARGGLIGIEAAPGSTRARAGSGGHDVDDVVRHIVHCAELTGVEHVALGGDAFYGDHLAIYRAGRSTPLSPDGAMPFDADHVAGAENPSEIPLQVAVRLLALGWSREDVAAVLGGNVMRLFRSVLHI